MRCHPRRNRCRGAHSYPPRCPNYLQEAEMLPLTGYARSTVVVSWILALTVLLLPQPVSAQFTTASLGGMVRDSSGAGIPDAAVNVLNISTGFTQDISTGANGAFLFSRLPIGTYVLRIEKQ